MKFIILFSLASLALISCGGSNSNDSSISAIQTVVEPTDEIAKYTVRLTMNIRDTGLNTTAAICSGTLFGSQYVLTADHCVNMAGLQKIYVQIGNDNGVELSDGTRFKDTYFGERVVFRRTFAKNFLDPVFNSKLKMNDVAIIKLDRPLELPYTLDYKLFTDTEKSFQNLMVTPTGYGIGKTSQLPFILRKSNVKVKVDDMTRDIFWMPFGESIRQGDSGGPVYFRADSGQLYLFGIISFLRFVPFPRTGAVKVSNHVEWIHEGIEKLNQDPLIILEDDDMVLRTFKVN